MKEPISLDLFFDDVCPSASDYLARVNELIALRNRFIFLVTPLSSQNSFARRCQFINRSCAVDVLQQLGGLGGVW
ncbi:hypothetical protein [Acidithiobacillus ferrianus]|uniref:hypothetical protein n=1 Tax=Acidithiobacillus ferrianus TaxID=2678518 RepID=UPI0034E3F575